ncbi:MAG: preprotein translocase subunit SecA [Actinomycetota bacterium]|jgi:preprotein translocase subunit SecA|nr:preprotein translocase subunit SecA [Actinomycetota bacterium]
MSIFTRVLRAGEGKKVRALQSLVPDINALEPEVEALSDEALAHKTVELRERLAQGEDLNDLLLEAFAVTREAARRVIGQRHFDVQLMGGAALHFGWIAEMKTGEGKTLVSTLPVYLNGLAGNGVHVVTVNDYLARRDAEWMGQIHRFLGLSVGRVSPEIDGWDEKKAAYDADVTYGTNTEFGFDYLRDNMARSLEHMVQRGHHYAIVDEVDSILIDEARTPLIISGPSDESARLYYQFAGIARSLVRDRDYEVDEEKRTVAPTEEGIERVEKALGIDNLYDLVSSNYVHQLTKALQSKELYKRDKDYIVADGEVKIVDEFTGRVLEGRRWSDGLHQAVEAKERVQIKEENHTWATVTLQNYFRMYEKLAGMTGTAETEASEFASTYELPVVPIPTNMPMVREDHADLIYKSEATKFAAVVEDIAERHEKGQPILVGTASVAKSEVLSELLGRRGIPHHVLNAKQHAREALVVVQAGRLGAVTVATNMAGRGVDILLGGNPEGLAAQEVAASGVDPASDEGRARHRELLEKFTEECRAEGERIRELGGLYVLGSERHESRRIDNQLRGRSGRQGDPGESRFFLSVEDELMRLFATGAMSWVMSRALPDDVPIDSKLVTRSIEKAQNTVEARNAEIRKDVLKYDEVMNEQRKVIYARRMQILEGEDLRARTVDVASSALDSIVGAHCIDEFKEDWNLDGLLGEARQYYPTQLSVEDLAECTTADQIYERLAGEAISYYEERERSMPGGEATMRDLEREVMLQLVDQKWRIHLSEMDYLREGINLRAMGQQDPLVAWQRDGYEMFGQLMSSIDDDYVKIVMHAQVVLQPVPGEESPELAGATYLAAGDPVEGAVGIERAALAGPAPGEEIQFASDDDVARARAGTPAGPDVDQPVVKDAVWDHVGRNDPCPCGSGKKFKFCHGR